jgi:hypothetical protein
MEVLAELPMPEPSLFLSPALLPSVPAAAVVAGTSVGVDVGLCVCVCG